MENSFGNRLKQLRKEHDNITQEELAKHLNINRATLSRYESGEVEPNINTVTDLAKYFNVSLDWLAGYSDIKNPHITSNNLLKLYNSLTGEYKVQAFNFLHYLNFISNNTFHNFKHDTINSTTISTNIPDNADLVTICDNDSMKPTIEKGEFIFIKKEESIINDDIILVDINGTSSIGKIKITKKDIKLIPINKTYNPISLTDTNYKIIGKIINK